jgi:RNA polymerase sigma-70 factor (ECF subfamily)
MSMGPIPGEDALRASLGGAAVRPALSTLADEELIAMSRAGEQAAFGEFVQRHSATVYRWMARAVGLEEAEDLTQEVFLKAFRGLDRFRGDAPPRAWLASIADNSVKNRYRARGRFRRIFAGSPDDENGPEPLADEPSPEDDADAGEERALVAEALRRLAPEFRMPVVLRDLEDWSYEEIASSLRIPVGTVKSRIARGRAQLKTILTPILRGEAR